MRVTHHKRITITNQPSNRVATIPIFGSLLEDTNRVEVLTDDLRNTYSFDVLITHLMVDRIVRLVEVKADIFQHGLSVSAKNRVLTTVDQFLVNFFLIGNRKITSEHQILCRPVRLTHEGVAIRRRIDARRTIAQMSHKHLTTVTEICFYSIRKLRMNHPIIHLLLIVFELLLKNAREWIGLNTTIARHVWLPRIHVQLHTTNTRAILAAIMLFLHEKK